MSELNELMNQLLAVIIDYHAAQKNPPHSLDEIKLKTTDELSVLLNTLIAESTTLRDSRKNFLEYIAHIFITWRDPIKSEGPLTDELLMSLQDTLVQLIHHSRQLFVLSHHSTLPIEYADKKIHAFGFNNGVISNSLCQTGQIIQNRLFDSLCLSSTPQISLDNTTRFIALLIHQHQSAKQLQESMLQKAELAREIEFLREANKVLSDENSTLRQTLQTIKEEPLDSRSFTSLAGALFTKVAFFGEDSPPPPRRIQRPSSFQDFNVIPQEPVRKDAENDLTIKVQPN